MILGGKKFKTKIPVVSNASLGVLGSGLYNPYFVWWWHNLYEYDSSERCIPYGCTFSSDGCTFGAGDYLDDLYGRHLLCDGTLGKWSHIYLTEGEVPFFGSAAGAGTKLYLNTAGTTPKITGKIILYPEYCPSLTTLCCYNNSISVLDVSALTGLTYLHIQGNSVFVLDVSVLTGLTYLNCADNSVSVLDVGALTSLTSLRCFVNSISVLDVSALTSLLTLLCYDNSMDQAMVDTVLCDVDGYGTSSGTLDIHGNAVPSAAGIVCKNNLVGRGWTVTTD